MKKIQTFQRAIHAFDRGELDTAKQLANELLTRQPNHPPVMTLLGKIYFEENDYAKSTLYLCESIKINPEESHNHFMLAKAYNAQRQPNKAITSLQQVLLLEPLPEIYPPKLGLPGLECILTAVILIHRPCVT